jgi:hypothetical protein
MVRFIFERIKLADVQRRQASRYELQWSRTKQVYKLFASFPHPILEKNGENIWGTVTLIDPIR